MGFLLKARSALPSPSFYMCSACSRRFRRTYATASQADIYDVVCVGGGPAGLSLLTALRSNPTTSPLRVALIDAQPLAPLRSWTLPPDKFSNRCSSLTPTSVRFLNHIGAWQHMARSRIQEYHHMQVWDGVSGARIEFDGLEARTEGGVVAYMTENLNITSGLLKRLDELGGVSMFEGERVEGIGYGGVTDEGWDLTRWPVVRLASGKSLTARLLVGADGANSPVRAFADIQARGWDYGRHGMVATLQLEGDGWSGPDFKTAYQRFLPTGPIAMLPLRGSYASMVWSTTPENAALLKRLSTKDFVAMVNAAFRLGTVDLEFMHTISEGQADEYSWRMQHTPVDAMVVPQEVVGVQEGTVASFPLKMRHADTYITERVALVGDAAHTIHPLAGQGLNQGQGDVQSLAAAIEFAIGHGQDLGSQLSLEKYNADRYFENHLMLGVCDKLHKLYSVGSGPLVPLRSIGLSAVNTLSPLKNFFMRQAAGNGIRIF